MSVVHRCGWVSCVSGRDVGVVWVWCGRDVGVVRVWLVVVCVCVHACTVPKVHELLYT